MMKYNNQERLAAYLAYKFRSATGDETLTVASGGTVRSESGHLRTSFMVRLSDTNLNSFSPETLDLLDNQFPRIFGVIPGESREERMGYNPVQNGVVFPYLLGDPTDLVELAQSNDKDGWRASQAAQKTGKPVQRRRGR